MGITLGVALELEKGNGYQEEWKPGSLVVDTKMSRCPKKYLLGNKLLDWALHLGKTAQLENGTRPESGELSCAQPLEQDSVSQPQGPVSPLLLPCAQLPTAPSLSLGQVLSTVPACLGCAQRARGPDVGQRHVKGDLQVPQDPKGKVELGAQNWDHFSPTHTLKISLQG